MAQYNSRAETAFCKHCFNEIYGERFFLANIYSGQEEDSLKNGNVFFGGDNHFKYATLSFL
jgi:hypothetical protein